MATSTSLNNFPNEILAHILKFAVEDCELNVLSLLQVCKRWTALLSHVYPKLSDKHKHFFLKPFVALVANGKLSELRQMHIHFSNLSLGELKNA